MPETPDERAVATPVAAGADAAPRADVIRVRAYERFLARGGAPGSDVEDWLAAERALLGADGGAMAAPPVDAPGGAAGDGAAQRLT